MDSTELTDALQGLLAGDFDGCEEALDAAELTVRSTSTFAEAGVLTTNDGLVLRLADGTEFQITIVRSR